MTDRPVACVRSRHLSDEDFATIAAQVRSMTGIELKPHKKAMVSARLSKRLRATGMSDVPSYVDLLNSSHSDREKMHFVSAFTTNMTRFNREEAQFQHMANQVLPDLVARARRGGRVRIWSAGCSSGEEPYGIACHIFDAAPEAASLDLRILATDIDADILSLAGEGVYANQSLEFLPKPHAERYFQPEGAAMQVRVSSQLKSIIRFRQLNLHDEWPFKGKFDIIMCRNVAIYFEQAVQTRLWQRFAKLLSPNGFLYLGHSETLDAGIADSFRFHRHGVYQFVDNISQVEAADQKSTKGRKP